MTTRPFHCFLPTVATIGVVALCMTTSPGLNAAEVQVGRYSTLPAMPTVAQADLLATTVSVSFPARIITVGEAVQYLLQRSGYRLADGDVMAPETTDMLTLPLPAVHRHLGPITLTQAMETLVGPAFRLIHDPAHRLISFELCTSAGRVIQQTDSSLKTEVPRDGE